MFHKILCAYDGSEHSKKALETAKRMCKENENAELFVVHTIKFEPIPYNVYTEMGVAVTQSNYMEIAKKHGEQTLNEAVDLVTQSGIKVHGLLFYGDPASTILEVANNKQIDLIVMGSRGLSTVKELFLGSVSHKIIQTATCSVLIVK